MIVSIRQLRLNSRVELVPCKGINLTMLPRFRQKNIFLIIGNLLSKTIELMNKLNNIDDKVEGCLIQGSLSLILIFILIRIYFSTIYNVFYISVRQNQKVFQLNWKFNDFLQIFLAFFISIVLFSYIYWAVQWRFYRKINLGLFIVS